MNKIIIAFVSIMIFGCSNITYKAGADGSTEASGFSLGTTRAMTGIEFETRADGSRILKIDELNTDQVEGMRQINQGLMLIIEGAVKGMK